MHSRLARARATVLATAVLALAAISGCNDTVGLSDGLGAGATGEDTAFLRGGNGRGGKNVVASIEITPSEFSVAAGTASRLQAVLRNNSGREISGTPSWLSTDPTVATVSDGSVSGMKPGSALILATVNGQTDTAVATITEVALPVDGVVLSPTEANLIVGERLSLAATAVASNGSALIDRTVTWSSASTAIATISPAGELVAVAPGTTTVVASIDGLTSSATVTVAPVPAVPVATISVTPAPAALREGATLELHARLLDGSGNDLGDRPVTWVSSNDGVVRVSGEGVLTGVTAGTATVTASAEGRLGTTSVTVTPSTIPVASIAMSTGSATIDAGMTVQLVATPKDAEGNDLGGRTITWATSNGGVATVSQAGLVQGVSAGNATITAGSEGRTAAAAITVNVAAAPAPAPEPEPPAATEPPPATEPPATEPPAADLPAPEPSSGDRVGYYVAPNGSSGNAGTRSSPWDLASVLRGSKPVAPGDTVWMLGGTYHGAFTNNMNGTSSRHIVVRQYPGVRATIDGSLLLFGSNVTFWGMEIMHSSPLSSGTYGINVKAPGARVINVVVHDAGRSGIGVWNEAPGAMVYGSVIYNNGTVDNKDHGIYFNGNNGTKYISDNIVFNNWQFGLHAYSPVSGELQSLQLDGNVSFNNGSIGPYGRGPDIYVGGSPITNLTVRNNLTWSHNDGEFALRVGSGSGLSYSGNRLVGLVEIGSFSGRSESGNVLWSSSSPPTSGVEVIVRPNAYEAGRANIIAYNWSRAGSVSADLSGVLRSGDTYEVRNAQNFYGGVVARGTYGGGSISLPMTAVQAPAPIGRSAGTPTSTGNVFHVFVVIKTN